MYEESKFWLVTFIIIAVTIISFTFIVTTSYERRMKFYVQNGYCEGTIQGSQSVVMIKCK